MAKLDEVIKDINKKIGFNIIGDYTIKKRELPKIPFKTPSLSYLFRGGLPRTTMTIAGAPSAGKSTLCYSILGQAQKELIKEWKKEITDLESLSKPKKEEKDRLSYLKERGSQKVVLLDDEFSAKNDWLEKNGVDIENLIYIAPENQTAEQLFQIILDLIDSDGVGLVAIDSVPSLVSQQTMNKSMVEKTMAGISAPMSTFCQKVQPLCNKHTCGLIFLSQPRADMAGYNRLILPGGKMLAHSNFILLLLKKGKYYDKDFKELNAHPETVWGNLVEVEVVKNKITKPDRKLAKFSISYDTGIDPYNDVFEMAVGLNILDKAGAWYSLLDDEGKAPKLDENGNSLKWQGKANCISYMKDNNKFYKELLTKVEKTVCKE